MIRKIILWSFHKSLSKNVKSTRLIEQGIGIENAKQCKVTIRWNEVTLIFAKVKRSWPPVNEVGDGRTGEKYWKQITKTRGRWTSTEHRVSFPWTCPTLVGSPFNSLNEAASAGLSFDVANSAGQPPQPLANLVQSE